METLLRLLVAVITAMFGDPMVASKVVETISLLKDMGDGVELNFVRFGWLSTEKAEERPMTARIIRDGGFPICAQGNYVPDDVVGVGSLTGYMSNPGPDRQAFPRVTGNAIGLFKRQMRPVWSRLTFFMQGKSLDSKAIELRIQTNLMQLVSQELVPGNVLFIGDPVKYNLAIFDKPSVENIKLLGADVEEFVDWTIVVQAHLEPYIKDGEWQQADPKIDKKGAKDDRMNALSGGDIQAWWFNASNFMIWLLPPGNSFQAESLSLEKNNRNVVPFTFGNQPDVTPIIREVKVTTSDFGAGAEYS